MTTTTTEETERQPVPLAGFPQAVRDILVLVQAKTGKLVALTEAADLLTMASVRVATAQMERHLLTFNPRHVDLMAHIVAHECGHILRAFQLPEPERLVAMTGAAELATMQRALEPELARIRPKLKPGTEPRLLRIWQEGICQQATSLPADISIELWLKNAYPELAEVQRRSVLRQAEQIWQGLAPNVAAVTPRPILEAAGIMGYAYLRLTGEALGVNLVKPFSTQPYLARAKRLTELSRPLIGGDARADRELSDLWSRETGIVGWYRWGLPPAG